MRSCWICQSIDRAQGRIPSILRDTAIFFLGRDVASEDLFYFPFFFASISSSGGSIKLHPCSSVSVNVMIRWNGPHFSSFVLT
jgi:hypothetical protein